MTKGRSGAGEPWRVRRAVLGDEPVLRALRLEALSLDPAAFSSTYDRELARTTADWQRWLAPGVTFILDGPNGPRGLVAGQFAATEATVVNLMAMWVHPAIRGAGAADELVAAVIGWAVSVNATTLRLDVFQDNTVARRFYERLGFRETGQSAAHQGSGRIEIRMERPSR